MTTESELIALAERCEAATGPDRELDEAIAVLVGKDSRTGPIHPSLAPRGYYDGPSYTASIDAALSLVPEGFSWAVGSAEDGGHATVSKMPEDDEAYSGGRLPAPEVMTHGYAATPALALTAAALRARAAAQVSA